MAFPLTLAAFRLRFGEFSAVDDATCQARLDDAEEEIDEDVWGDLAERGHGWLAAHLLSASAYGRDGAKKDDTTTYGARYEALVARVGGAYRVLLD